MRMKKADRSPKAWSAWRTVSYHAELEPQQSTTEPLHPVDGVLNDLPDLRRKLATVRKREKSVQPFLTDRKAFVKYADAQVDYRYSLQVEAFNLGVELGLVVGRVAPQTASQAAKAPLPQAVLTAALRAASGPAGRLISLLTIAEAFVSGPADLSALKKALESFAARQRPVSTKVERR